MTHGMGSVMVRYGGCEPAQPRGRYACMVVRRILAVLILLAYTLALTVPAAPAVADEVTAAMPCHEDMSGSPGAPPVPVLRCCMPVCCGLTAPALPAPAHPIGQRLSFALLQAEPFSSLSIRPRVPPPRA